MAFSIAELSAALLDALSQVFGLISDGHVRVGKITFSGANGDEEWDASDIPAAVKPLSMGRLFTEHVTIVNSAFDDNGSATAAKYIILGDETTLAYVLTQAMPPLTLDWVDLSKIRVAYLGADLTADETLVVRWVAHGRRMR